MHLRLVLKVFLFYMLKGGYISLTFCSILPAFLWLRRGCDTEVTANILLIRLVARDDCKTDHMPFKRQGPGNLLKTLKIGDGPREG